MPLADLGVIFPSAHRMGGVERIALETCERLAGRRSVEFIGRQYVSEHPSHVRFRPVDWVPAQGPTAFRRAAASVLQRERPETLLSFGVNCPPGDVYWVQSVHKAWLRSGSAVTLKGVRVPSAARRLLGRHRELLRLEREYFVDHAPRAILCTSSREADDLHHFYGVPFARMHVVPNGYDGRRFRAAERGEERSADRAKFGINEDQISILFAVNELHRKGFAVLLDAVSLVADSRLRIDIVGSASPEPYRRRIASLRLSDRVHWHGGTSRMEDYMAASDLLVLPTQYEPFGLVIVEALACGLPVITTALAGAAPAVVPGVGLLQRDPHDARELAHLLGQALVPGQLGAWAAAAPAAARPFEWAEVMRIAEPLILG